MKTKVFCYLLVFSVVLVFSGLQAVAGEKGEMLKPHSEVQKLEKRKGEVETIQEMKQLKEKGEKGVETIQSEPAQIAPTPEIRQKGETSIIDVPGEK